MPSTLRVRRGDSPMGLARAYTGDGGRLEDLVEANPHKTRVDIGGVTTFVGLAAGEVLRAPPSWDIRNFGRIALSELQIASHVMAPPRLAGVIYDRGRGFTGVREVLAKRPPSQTLQPAGGGFGRLPPFSPPKFQAEISKLRNWTNGYAMELRQNGTTIASDSWGWASMSQPWSLTIPQDVASVSKIFTAVAMVKSLKSHSIPLDQPIPPFLPVYWAKGPNIDKITFASLLKHTSGFNNPDGGPDLPYAKAQVAQGVELGAVGVYAYRNVNYSLCRMLLAVVEGNMDPRWSSPLGVYETDTTWDLVAIRTLEQYVGDSIFAVAGVEGPTLTRRPNSAYAYTWPPGSPWDSGDLSVAAGPGGWHMTVREVLDVLGALRRTSSVLPMGDFDAHVINPQFGIDEIVSTPLGLAWTKGGIVQHTTTGQTDAASLSTEQSVVWVLPKLGLELSMHVNSPVGPGDQALPGQVLEAFYAAAGGV